MIKKQLAVLLAFLLLFLAGCGAQGESSVPSAPPNAEKPAAVHELRLLFCENDTMNPYKTVSKLNAELSSLLFEPLMTVDNSFEAVNILAASCVMSDKTCTVTLKDVVFSDGSPLTADDVLYSFELAKKSTRFAHLFYEVEALTAENDKTLVFTLTVNDPYFSKLLTFPILKSGSDELKNEDNVELVPIGTGKYVFSDDMLSLVPNKHFRSDVGSIDVIRLINAPDNESMQHYVEVGATDIYYAEMYDDNIIRMSGKKHTVNLNNLIYIGINHEYAPLKSAHLRYAISSALSRSEIIDEAHYTDALAATGFFHPAWKEISGYQTIQPKSDLKISVENLANIGYNILNDEGFYENSKGKTLELSLLVNKDSYTKTLTADLIAEQLKVAGIKVTVDAREKTAYFEALENGDFQLYLGEVKLLPNMDVSCLVTEGGTAAYGIVKPKETADDEKDKEEEKTDDAEEEYKPDELIFDDEFSYLPILEGYQNGENTSVDVASALLASMPVIPLAYRSSIVFYSDNIEEFPTASCFDIFFKSDEFKLKK